MSDIVKRYKTIKCCGISLEDLKELIREYLNLEELEINIFDKSEKGIDIVLSAEGDIEDEAKAKIKPVYKEIKSLLGNKVFTTNKDKTLEEVVVDLLEEKEISLSVAESCTGGLLSARLIDVPGVSEVFREGFITYTNKAKRKTLNVSKQTLASYGAVSSQTAKEMALGASVNSGSDAALSITGIAGPTGETDTKPIGLVYIACYLNYNIKVEKYNFEGNRTEIRKKAVEAALDLLRRCILEQK